MAKNPLIIEKIVIKFISYDLIVSDFVVHEEIDRVEQSLRLSIERIVHHGRNRLRNYCLNIVYIYEFRWTDS